MSKTWVALAAGALALGVVAAADKTAPPQGEGGRASVETIVCLRHGEKPPGGLGQLTCKGLNRALALPDVLLTKFGTPAYIFAPNPTEKVDGLGGYYYVRPLATIEPTAILCGMPVNTKFGYLEITGLQQELDKSKYHKATVFVAWEHVLEDQFVKNLVKAYGGDAAKVPGWPGSDYDSLFVVRITRNADATTVSFTHDHEGLTNLSDAYPKPAR